MPTIQSNQIKAEFAAHGAELIRLQDRSGRDFLWNGDAAWWSGRAPLLFPIVGKVPNDRILVDGREYAMRQHGFARTSQFVLTHTDASECGFRLRASDETRAQFPFGFTLDVSYAARGPSLLAQATVLNSGDRPMPISFGFHPALRWPLPGGGPKQDHVLRFEQSEAAPVRRLHDGLLTIVRHPTPVEGRCLPLNDTLFTDGAVIFDQLLSRAVTYLSPLGASIAVTFDGMPHLGVWSKPGADFICIEPWQGYAAAVDFHGELSSKEGMMVVQPGAVARFSMVMTIHC
jgi:galactose mutarotase-like enzyme